VIFDIKGHTELDIVFRGLPISDVMIIESRIDIAII